ncbi:LysR family transcriptional regulator [Deinococcus arenicola]|uniref:LysR family transcriptional regulator n=1 Tax=Deinococcus arenicola TaxID=2994950 RepID=A0ABU4DM33_9DEIO|nr:LysR family transcriptional regulator [Deinococcus sp. ZS9-10]MDV6372997.1 LysR family transcriptional regulator [Deinococcus sp. ZS9-10]
MAMAEGFRVFVAIYRAGSVSGAARERHLTQPAVSAQLAALEARVGEALFFRTPRGVTPTERGKLLYAGVADAVDRLDAVARDLRVSRPLNPDTPLRLGTTPEFLQGHMLPRLGDWTGPLHLSFGDGRGMLERVEAGTLDAALVNTPPQSRALSERPLTEVPYVLIGPADWPAPDVELGGLAAWMNGRPWVSSSVELPVTRRFFLGVLGVRFAARQALVAPDLRAVVGAVEAGLGATLVPLFAVHSALHQGRVRELWDVRPLIAPERWRMVYRVTDEDRQSLRALNRRLGR